MSSDLRGHLDGNENDSEESLGEAYANDDETIGLLKEIAKYSKVIEMIVEDVKSIKKMYNSSKNIKDLKQRKESYERLDAMIDNAAATLSGFKKHIEKLNYRVKKLKSGTGNSTAAQSVINQYQYFVSEFRSVYKDYSTVLDQITVDRKKQVKRAAKAMAPTMEEDELEQIATSFEADQILAQMHDQSEEHPGIILQKLDEIVDANARAKRVELRIKKIHDMWEDFEFLISLNQDKIDHITDSIEQTKNYVIKGMEDLEAAQDYQEKANQNKMRTIFCGSVCCCIGVAAAMFFLL